MLKLILSSLQLLPLRPLSPLCQVPTLLLTPLMLSLLQMKTRCRRIEKKTAVSCLFILSGTAQSPKLSLIPSSLKLLPILLRLLPQLPVASCPCCQVPLSSMLAMKSPLNTGLTTLKSSLSPLRLHCHTVTKMTCSNVEIPLPNTTCELVLRNRQSSYQTNHSQIHRRQGPKSACRSVPDTKKSQEAPQVQARNRLSPLMSFSSTSSLPASCP